MPLTPNAIFQDLINKDLDKHSAIELLLALVDNAENADTRIESLKILNKIQIDDENTFRSLEHLLISDLNDDVRNLTCQVLQTHYKEKALDPMIWAFEHEKSLKCLITIISAIAKIENDKSKSVLVSNIRKLQKKQFNTLLKDSIDEKNIRNISINELAEILINYHVILSLKKKFGYFKYRINDLGLINELDLSNIERFSSGQNKLENYLDSIFSLRDLRKCDLRFNHLIKIPESFKNSIEYLDLSYNKIVKLPDLYNFTVIKTLNLKSNRLRDLPYSIGSLSSIEVLNLRNNVLTSLPESIKSLAFLKTLDLHGNKFSDLPIILSKSVKELDLGWNNLKTLPESIKPLLALEKLGLGGNKLLELPEWLGFYTSLKELDLYDNNLSEVPKSIGSLKSLERLNIRNNNLTKLPSSFMNLLSLKSLNLSWNDFLVLPEWIGSLTALEELNLWGNRLEVLPDSITSLSSLKILDLNFNKIKHLPPPLRELERKNELIIKL
ncbi:MAG: leucine-rich repeat domain-containing protein [Promethearchaeota archaeon]|jgi:Leucine-rich repeat (LRR) protein